MPENNNHNQEQKNGTHHGVCVIGCGHHIPMTIAQMFAGCQTDQDAISRASEMIDAGLEPEEAAQRNGLTMNDLVAHHIIPPVEQEYVVPVSYQVNGYVVVTATSAPDAIQSVINAISAGQTPILDNSLIEPDSEEVSLDSELVDVYSRLHREGKFRHPVTKTVIRAKSQASGREPETKPDKDTVDETAEDDGDSNLHV